MWDQDPKKVLKFTDNVIYYKRKMEKEGKRVKEPPLVHIHKKDIKQRDEDASPIFNIRMTQNFSDALSINTHNQAKREFQKFDYRNTKFYQNKPHLCEVAAITNKAMLDMYSWDKRYEVDENEYIRLNKESWKSCTEHGSHNDLKLQRMAQFQMMTQRFYKDLFDPRHLKVKQGAQAQFLVSLIRDTENEKDFQLIRKNLRDILDAKKDIQFKELNERMPLFFLKNKKNTEKVTEESEEEDADEKYYSLDKNYLFKVKEKVIELLGEENLKNFIKNDDPTCKRAMKRLEDKNKYYEKEKAIAANPKGEQDPAHNFDTYLRLNYERRDPIFHKIENGALHLEGYPIREK